MLGVFDFFLFGRMIGVGKWVGFRVFLDVFDVRYIVFELEIGRRGAGM